MKFVVDAHLPRRLCGVLASHGHEAVHTLDLPAGNATSDEAITLRAPAYSRGASNQAGPSRQQLLHHALHERAGLFL
jgi:uncharacterized protein DUF5615